MANNNRAPASGLRVFTESATVGGPLAVLLAYASATYLPQIPPPVQVAAAATVVGFVNSIFSYLRNKRIGGKITGAN